MSARPPEFFVGWAGPGPVTARFLRAIAAALVCFAILAGVALGTRLDDPTERLLARTANSEIPLPREVTMTGRAIEGPAALLYVEPGPFGRTAHTVLVSGDGKNGPGEDWRRLRGRSITATGAIVRRGDIDMLILGEPPRAAASQAPAPPPPVDLGRWRLVGEICDGKCVAGAMRPGSGLAHRACATLCLDGDIPAVFVTTAPVMGHTFLVLADAEGDAPFPAFRDLVGRRMTLEGRVERHGDIAIFKAELPMR